MHSGSGRRSPALGSELTFATRTGSRQGVEMHVFRVETHRDLSAWTRVLVQGCHAAAELIKEVTVGECRGAGTPGPLPSRLQGLTAALPAGCTLGGQEVQLSIHYEGGFTISRDEPGSSVLFRYPYERLKMSADDGIRTLYLDFGGPEGELVRRGQPGSPPGLGGSSSRGLPASSCFSLIPAASQLPRLTGFGWLEPPIPSAHSGTWGLLTLFSISPQALDLHSCPKPIVFVLHTFLSAKVTRMGLLA